MNDLQALVVRERELKRRIEAAVDVAYGYAQTDGAHHKLWVINKMLRELMGEQGYKTFVDTYYVETGERWDHGIAP